MQRAEIFTKNMPLHGWTLIRFLGGILMFTFGWIESLSHLKIITTKRETLSNYKFINSAYGLTNLKNIAYFLHGISSEHLKASSTSLEIKYHLNFPHILVFLLDAFFYIKL